MPSCRPLRPAAAPGPRRAARGSSPARRSISLVGELGGERVGRELRAVEDLVRPGTADAGKRALVAEERVQAPGFAARDLAELVRGDLGGLRAEVGQLRVELVRSVHADTGALLRASLREDQLAAVLEAQPERRRLRPLRARLQEADAPGAHQVDMEDELAVVGGEEEVLAPPAGSCEAPALQSRERRVERLQRARRAPARPWRPARGPPARRASAAPPPPRETRE